MIGYDHRCIIRVSWEGLFILSGDIRKHFTLINEPHFDFFKSWVNCVKSSQTAVFGHLHELGAEACRMNGQLGVSLTPHPLSTTLFLLLHHLPL